jgi:hypothetical protein
LKKVSIVLLALVVFGVLISTFQGPTQTTYLSETVRGWVGYKGDSVHFRSDVNYVEYFIVGLVMAVFGLSMRWKFWILGVIGCGFGLLDEVIKIALPTREFSSVDLIKDFAGIWMAVGLVYGISRIKKEKMTSFRHDICGFGSTKQETYKWSI